MDPRAAFWARFDSKFLSCRLNSGDPSDKNLVNSRNSKLSSRKRRAWKLFSEKRLNKMPLVGFYYKAILW